MSLRPYQHEAIALTRDAIRQGHRRVCLVIPTGGGKTRTAAEIIRSAVAKGRRALFLAHRAELVDQAVGALQDAGLIVGAISASAQSAPQPFAPVQVATMQTLIARKLTPPADIIVFDEAHHSPAATFSALIGQYPPSTVVLGLTATPERSDGKGLGAMFTSLVVGARVKQLIELGHLVPAEIIRPQAKLKEFQIAARPVDAYLEHARRRRAIAFCPRVAMAEECAAEFRALGVRAASIEGNTPWQVRRDAFAALRSGDLDVLTNVYVATEGFDVPVIDCVILARGIGTAGGYLQMIGRGLRPSPGKSDCLVLDLNGVSHDHGAPEDDRTYSLDGKGISSPATEAAAMFCTVCKAVLDRQQPYPCPTCGFVPPVPEFEVTGERLIPYQSKRAEPDQDRAFTLAWWIKQGVIKKHKPTAAMIKYERVYGMRPTAAIVARAHSINQQAKRLEPAAT